MKLLRAIRCVLFHRRYWFLGDRGGKRTVDFYYGCNRCGREWV